MRRLIRNLSLAGACAAALLCGSSMLHPASAQIATGQGDKGPIDISADKLDKYDEGRKVVYTGNVEAVQNGARLVSDTLTILFDPATPPPGSPAKPASGPNSTAQDGFGDIRQAIAEGHVFYVTQTQTVRGEHGVYDAAPDTVTMTGDVVVVQGKNVQRGDKMVMELKSGHTQVFSDVQGRNKPNRVRGVFYSENKGGDGQSNTPAAPAKKP